MSDERDPWSTDQPVGPAPIEFVFDEPDAAIDTNASSGVSSPAHEPAVVIDTTARKRWIGSAVVLGVAVVVLGVAVGSRSDDDPASTDDSVSGATTVPAADGTLPDSATTLPTPSSATPTTVAAGSLPEAGGDTTPPRTWIDGQFELPDRFTAFDTQIRLVALSSQGLVIEIDLPSGATSTLDLDQRRSGSRLHVRDQVALITSDSGGRSTPPTLVQRGKTPIEVELPGNSSGVFVYDNGANVGDFFVETFNSSTGESDTLRVGVDGSVVPFDTDFENFFYGQFEVVTGERLVFDAGDLFLLSPQGQKPESARRLSTGTLIGRSPVAVLVDECDAQRSCGAVLIDIESGDRTTVPDSLIDDFRRDLQVASMSPDGTAMLLSSGPDGTSVVYDLMTGVVTEVSIRFAGNGSNTNFSWSPDSSGIFAADTGEIVYIDRVTGESTPLPIEFGRTDTIVDVHARAIES